jgi:UDP-3-O-[3-hydroxymyristoyl] glucosamine N-acyltransferase
VLLSHIAKHLELSFVGDDCEITSMNELDLADKNELSFALSAKYTKQLETSQAKAFLIPQDLLAFLPQNSSYIVCDDVSLSMASATKIFAPKPIDFDAKEAVVGKNSFIDEQAKVEKGAMIGSDVVIMAGAYIGSNVTIGDHTLVYPNVTIYRDCVVGSNCIIHAGTVIGADGFGYSHTKEGVHVKIHQNGNVVLEDDVEIGSNTSIDRAVFNSTLIKKGTKIDNLVHIAHNCEIGEYSIIAGQTGFAGSVSCGRNTVFGSQSGIAGHLSIAPFNTFAARSGVTKSIKESGGTYSGFPIMDHREWRRLQVKIKQLNQKG